MLKRGDTIRNRYTIKQVISSSDRTSVYLVDDSELMKEWIMKEFVIRIDNPQAVAIAIQKFKKEVTVLAGLRHACIPEIVDHFAIANRQYLIMEYIQGKNLSEVLDETFQPMHEPDVLRFGIQLAGILHYLHKQVPTIIFRDLRPSNIMVTRDKLVKLINFGLGRHFRSIKDINTRKIGTPGYAPPEQFGRDIFDRRTDIYSLGSILHQLITLRNPTKISNVFKFPPITEINAKASKQFEEIIRKATGYQSSERYFNALDMKREMEALLTAIEAGRKKRAKTTTTGKVEEPKIEFFIEPVEYSKYESVEEEKESLFSKLRPALKKAVIPIIAVLVIIIIILGGIYLFSSKKKKPVSQNTIESPFANIKDKRVLKIRQEGIRHYEKGVKNFDNAELALAISLLQKVVTAHPADVISHIYIRNATILIKKKPYVRVAVLASITGSNFEAGMLILSGVALGQFQHNRSGKGEKIFVEIFDNKSKPEENIKLASELSKRKDLLAVIGPVRSPYVSSSSTFFNDSKIVQISPTGSCADIENLGEYIFRTSGDGRDLSSNMANFTAGNLRLKRIAVIFDPTQSYSKTIGELFNEKIMKKKGITTKVFHISLDSSNYSSLVKEIKEYNPDGIFTVIYHDQQGEFSRELKKAGIKAVQLSTVSIYSPQLIKDGGRAVEGIIFSSSFYPGGVFPVARKFIVRFDEKYGGIRPNFRAAFAYDSTMAISTALDRGVTTSEGLKNFLKNTLGKKVKFEGATGVISFDKHGKREKRNLVHITVKNGKFVLYR